MGVDTQKKAEGPLTLNPLSPFPSPPLEVGPLNPARGLGERCKLPQQGLGLYDFLLVFYCKYISVLHGAPFSRY